MQTTPHKTVKLTLTTRKGYRIWVEMTHAPWRLDAVEFLFERGDVQGLSVVLAELIEDWNLLARDWRRAPIVAEVINGIGEALVRPVAALWIEAIHEPSQY